MKSASVAKSVISRLAQRALYLKMTPSTVLGVMRKHLEQNAQDVARYDG